MGWGLILPLHKLEEALMVLERIQPRDYQLFPSRLSSAPLRLRVKQQGRFGLQSLTSPPIEELEIQAPAHQLFPPRLSSAPLRLRVKQKGRFGWQSLTSPPIEELAKQYHPLLINLFLRAFPPRLCVPA